MVTIRLRLSNAFLVLGQRPVLVDTGSPGEERKILRMLARYGLTPSDLSLIFHTHGHADHCGSTRALKQLAPHVPAVIHRADAERLQAGHHGPLYPTSPNARILGRFLSGRFPAFEADRVFEAAFPLQEFGLAGQVVSTPGHTGGSVSLILAGGDALVGDLVIGGFLGGLLAARKPGLPYFADDIQELYGSVEKLLEAEPKRLYVGHGGPLEVADVRKWLAGQRTPEGWRP